MKIEHPDRFKTGTRVLLLKGRHKDGIEKERAIVRVTHSVEHFNKSLFEMIQMVAVGERIYSSAGERSMPKAIREFKHRQLDADYDDDPEMFYRAINERWVASLMQVTSQADKLWLFDCDTESDEQDAMRELLQHYDRPEAPYRYRTKSGMHIVVQPFDRTKLSESVRKLIQDNALLLWWY